VVKISGHYLWTTTVPVIVRGGPHEQIHHRPPRRRGQLHAFSVIRRLIFVVLLAVMVGTGGPTGAPAAPAAAAGAGDPVAVDRFIMEQMERHRIPGVSVALFKDGRIIYTAGYGKADRDAAMDLMPSPSGTCSITPADCPSPGTTGCHPPEPRSSKEFAT